MITSEIAYRNFSPLLPVLFPFGGFTMVLLARHSFPPFRGFLKKSIYNHISNAIHSTSQDPRQSRGVLAALKLASASDGLSFLFGCSFI